ncbi:MAG: hypothetical protein U0165_11070 [Polyangiaceae bacterium]
MALWLGWFERQRRVDLRVAPGSAGDAGSGGASGTGGSAGSAGSGGASGASGSAGSSGTAGQGRAIDPGADGIIVSVANHCRSRFGFTQQANKPR